MVLQQLTFCFLIRFASLFTEFIPGYVVSYLITMALSYSQKIYIRLTQELINKKTIESENEKKTIELEVYTKRLQAEIEERYHAEQVLRKSEEQYRNLVEKAGLMVDQTYNNVGVSHTILKCVAKK